MRWLPGVLLLGACTAPDAPLDGYFADGGYILEGSHANILRTFDFTVESEPGVVEGFDLDGKTTPEGEESSCGHGDYADPNGAAGVDNQLAAVWTLAAPLIGEAVEGLLQGAINEGRFLLVLELEGVDDLDDDEDVRLHLFRGRAEPIIGSQGLISPDQTVYVDPSIEPSVLEGVRIDDRSLEAGPLSFELPIDILEANFIAPITRGRIRLTIHEDGSFEGLLGGVINVAQMLGELLATDGAAEAALVQPIFEANADMGFDGRVCTELSSAFRFEGTTAFVVREP